MGSLALLSGGDSRLRVRLPQKNRSKQAFSTAMTKTDADCLRLLPDRRLGSLHRLRDLHHRCPRFRVGFELPYVVFSPRIANGSLLFRHGFYLLAEPIVTRFLVMRRRGRTWRFRSNSAYSSPAKRRIPMISRLPTAPTTVASAPRRRRSRPWRATGADAPIDQPGYNQEKPWADRPQCYGAEQQPLKRVVSDGVGCSQGESA